MQPLLAEASNAVCIYDLYLLMLLSSLIGQGLLLVQCSQNPHPILPSIWVEQIHTLHLITISHIHLMLLCTCVADGFWSYVYRATWPFDPMRSRWCLWYVWCWGQASLASGGTPLMSSGRAKLFLMVGTVFLMVGKELSK